MKLLLDENLPHQLRHEIHGHDCFTTAYLGWTGIENGDLLARAASAGFDALITKDANLQYEQNLAHLSIAIIIIRAASHDIDDIRPLLPQLSKALHSLTPNAITSIP